MGVTRFAHDTGNMLVCGEVTVGGNHDVIRLSLLQNDKSELANGSSSIKSGRVEITPRWLNNLPPLLIHLQGNRLQLSSAKCQKNQEDILAVIVLHSVSTQRELGQNMPHQKVQNMVKMYSLYVWNTCSLVLIFLIFELALC